jgi:short-subunit dehydrogenase
MIPYVFPGRTAVLTGAASGIGEQIAYGLAGRGSDLVLVDRDAARLKDVADRIERVHPGRNVQTIVADLGDRHAVEEVATQVLAEHPVIGLLINNAGMALGGRFDQVTVAEFETVMNVNFRAPMLLTHALLPALKACPGSHLVNVSSLFGLIAPAGQSAYSASKFALRGLSQVLHSELADDGIGVTTVHPGGVRTRIAESAVVGSGVPESEVEPNRKLFAKLLTYPPDRAAREILDGVAKRKARVLIASSAKVPDLLARLLPVAHERLIRAATSARGSRPGSAHSTPVAPAAGTTAQAALDTRSSSSGSTLTSVITSAPAPASSRASAADPARASAAASTSAPTRASTSAPTRASDSASASAGRTRPVESARTTPATAAARPAGSGAPPADAEPAADTPQEGAGR